MLIVIDGGTTNTRIHLCKETEIVADYGGEGDRCQRLLL